MPGATQTYKTHGKRRPRKTKFFYLGVRENTWYDVHRLRDKFGLSLADTIGLLVAKNLEACNVEPTTLEGLAKLGPNAMSTTYKD